MRRSNGHHRLDTTPTPTPTDRLLAGCGDRRFHASSIPVLVADIVWLSVYGLRSVYIHTINFFLFRCVKDKPKQASGSRYYTYSTVVRYAR